jgi:phosphopantothenoylcysteine decarboxylase/phosphopantothenate--cysteine ligase
MLQYKKILIGISGGIAAYKCAQLVRLFIKEGAEVKVILTPAASQFITTQTLSVLSKNEVITDFFDNNHNWNNHVKLAEWADLMLIAPLTANTLAKMANGQCDNVLLATYFSAHSKIFVAPAMDFEMYQHPTVLSNLQTLKSNNNIIIPAETGELASGLIGEGRMAEPENILNFIKQYLSLGLPLLNKTVLINAGPTYEAIDPVRFIGNRSSGKMGIAIAECLAEQGAIVTLVLGPSSQIVKNKSIKVIHVESTQDMFEACLENYENKDIVICSAAVADYKLSNPSSSKLKKKETIITLELTKTKDILQTLGEKKQKQFLVGFALETENLTENAKDKLVRKNLDLIVANDAKAEGVGFGHDTNAVTLIDKHNNITNLELKNKSEIAKELVAYIYDCLNKKNDQIK